MQFGFNKDYGVDMMKDELFNSLGTIVRWQYQGNVCSDEHIDVFFRSYGTIMFYAFENQHNGVEIKCYFLNKHLFGTSMT